MKSLNLNHIFRGGLCICTELVYPFKEANSHLAATSQLLWCEESTAKVSIFQVTTWDFKVFFHLEILISVKLHDTLLLRRLELCNSPFFRWNAGRSCTLCSECQVLICVWVQQESLIQGGAEGPCGQC